MGSKLFLSVLFISLLAVFSAHTATALTYTGKARLTATEHRAYYGDDFYTEYERGSRNQQMKGLLRVILTSDHLPVPGKLDRIELTGCQGSPGCYRHTPVTYNRARVFILGDFYLVPTSNGYGVKEVYCSRVYDSPEFGQEKPGPGKIPADKVVNVEHTWPQSRFNHRYSADMQKADMHHLFPSDSQVNSTRGNYEFGNVTHSTQDLDCTNSKFGVGSAGGSDIFEPPNQHKGNVARALFYFSTKYDLVISAAEESVLKQWNHSDPVDDEEIRRNEAIFKLQGSRNPFIDYPDLADRITDF